MKQLSLTINGAQKSVAVQPNALLVDVLRDDLGLTGTHIGCDTSQCGACVVRLGHDTVKSCSVLAATLRDGSEVTTIEGIAQDDLHPMQMAFSECHGLQCGYCTPGFVLTAIDIVEKNPGGVSADLIRKELKGNLCRCTGYQNIIAAILKGAEAMGVPTIETEGGTA